MDIVNVGSVWADNDPRSKGRTLRIDAIEDDKVLCTVLTNMDSGTYDRRGKQVRIALARFKPTVTGYRLVEDAAP